MPPIQGVTIPTAQTHEQVLYTPLIKAVWQGRINLWKAQHTRETFSSSKSELVEKQIICILCNSKGVPNRVRKRTSQLR